jgi:TusA-related sulfurtransferase
MKRILVAITMMTMAFSASAEYPIYEDDPSGFCYVNINVSAKIASCERGDLLVIAAEDFYAGHYTFQFCDFTKPIQILKKNEHNGVTTNLCIYRGKERPDRN